MHARTVAAVLVALVVGLVIGCVVGSAPTSSSEVSRAKLHGVAASDVRTDVRVPREELAASEASARTNGLATDEAAVPPGAITRAAARAPAVSVPTADGAISGRVVDTSGAGVAGVLVRVNANAIDAPHVHGGDADAFTSAPALESHLEAAALAWAAARSREATARTDADGRFEVPALGGSDGCRVDAHLAGWSVTPRGANEQRFAGERVEFLAQRLAAVEFALLRDDGTPFDEGVVEVVERGITRYHTWRSDSPVLALAPGHVEVRARDALEIANGIPTSNAASTSVAFEVVEGESRRVELVLVAISRVVGRIEGPDGRVRRQRQSVTIQRHVDGRVPTDAELKSSYDFVDAPNGEFDVRGLALGPWEFAIRDRERNVVARKTVDVAPGRVDVTLVLPPEQTADFLRVRVLEPNGRAASDFVLDAVLANHKALRVVPGECDGEGWYALRLRDLVPEFMARSRSVPVDPWSELVGLRLCAVSKLVPYSGSVDVPPGTSEVVLQLEPPGVVEVVVHGLVGSPFEVATRVEAWRQPAPSAYGGNDPWEYPRATRAEGGATWTFEGLAPGVHFFSVVASRGSRVTSDGGRRILTRRVDVRPGAQRIEFTLPSLHTVHVHAPGLDEGAELELDAVEGNSQPNDVVGSSRREHLDARLRARFVDVTPGRYALECDDLRERVEFDVPCAEVVIDVPVWNAQRVVLTEPMGPCSTAGLQDGDLVVELEGVAPVTPSRWSRVFDRNPNEPCAVVVLRGGERVTLDLRPVIAAYNDDGYLDGEFLRTSVDR
jgi:hypothetical protein